MKRLTAQEKKILFESESKVWKRIFSVKNNIIGLDLGTQMTGLYAPHLGGSKLLMGGSSKSLPVRINNIKEQLEQLLRMAFKPSIVIVEDYAFALTQSSLAQLAELGGVVKIILLNNSIPYVRVAPPTLKKFVLGPGRKLDKGTNKKAVMMVETLSRWGEKFNDDNLCDSFCLYQFGVALKSFLNNHEDVSKWEQAMFRQLMEADRLTVP